MKKQHPPEQTRPYFDEEGHFYFHPVSSDARKAVPLPAWPARVWTFFERFQSSCVLECCGLSALAFKPPTEWDKRWNFNSEVFNWLEDQVECAEEMEGEVVRIPEFQQALYTDDWLFLLRYLIKDMESSKQWK